MSTNFNYDDEDPAMRTKLVVHKQWYGNLLKLTYRLGDIERVAYLITSPNSQRIISKREPNWN